VLSEYGITKVSGPVHVNRALREAKLLEVRPTPAGEVLDTFASQAFVVADHQVAHVYVQDERALARARETLERTPGIGQVLDRGRRGASPRLCAP